LVKIILSIILAPKPTIFEDGDFYNEDQIKEECYENMEINAVCIN